MKIEAKSVDDYLQKLDSTKRAAIEAVRDVVNKSIQPGFEEGILYNMIGWYVPFARYSTTYNKQPLVIASLGAQKNYGALYLMPAYAESPIKSRFEAAFKSAGKKLDMGKSCVRFLSADDLALDAIADAIKPFSVDDWIAIYEKSRLLTKAGAKKKATSPAAKKKSAKKPAKKKSAKSAKKTSSKKKTR